MVGIIVTGHGKFAESITTAMELITGVPEDYLYINFEASDTMEGLMEKLENGIKELNHCKNIIIFTDLAGGTPFNVSAQLKIQYGEYLEVLGGSNLPMVLEASVARLGDMDIDSLTKEIVESGRNQILRFKLDI